MPRQAAAALRRLADPVEDVVAFVTPRAARWARLPMRSALLHATDAEHEAFWGWDRERWVAVLERTDPQVRQLVMAVAYLLCGQRDLHRAFPGFKRGLFAQRVFGAAAVDASLARVQAHLDNFGYAPTLRRPGMTAALFELMLCAGSPLLEDVAAQAQVFAELYARERPVIRYGIAQLAGALVGMGLLARSPLEGSARDEEWIARSAAPARDVPAEWAGFVARWFCTSTLSRRSREHHFYMLLKAGRWIAEHDPAAISPAAWRRHHAAAWIAAVDRMRIGEYSHAPNTNYMRERSGGALGARTKAAHIGTLRTFFSDLQEWEWIERRFDPGRVLTTPRSVMALIGPEPRVIADDAWAKLLWAGLNLTAADLPAHARSGGEPWYPLELVRAIALLWLFGGLRNDEIVRLRLGAIRWQNDGALGGDNERPPVCLLDVPTNKTGTSFTKPVDRVVGEAIEQWERVRAPQPRFVDAKTAEAVDFLFAHRGARIGRTYINRILIGLLCAKAGVPRSDVRGKITSHRGRATIASQLYNAKDPMSLFELQAWLGHSSPESTRHYAQITPTTLARAYSDAGYFQRNLRTIEVLLDRDAIQSGAAAGGEPYEFYDLGHGYCTYSFFEQCPHRMACARCDFYLPKTSSRAQLVEASSAMQRMLVEIPLTDDEQAVVENDQRAVGRLLGRLADTPTPAGPTPRDLGRTATPPPAGSGDG
jgi:integrase